MSQIMKQYDPNDDEARTALEEYCYDHTAIQGLREDDTPFLTMGNPLLRIVNALDISRNLLCRTNFFDALLTKYNVPQDAQANISTLSEQQIKFMLAVSSSGEPVFLKCTDEFAIIEEAQQYGDVREPSAYTAEELIFYLMTVVNENNKMLADKREEGIVTGPNDMMIMPRAYYDALLHICAKKLRAIDAELEAVALFTWQIPSSP